MPARAMAQRFGSDSPRRETNPETDATRSEIQALIESPELRRIFDEKPGQAPDARRAAAGRHRRDPTGQSGARRAGAGDDRTAPRRRSRGLRIAVGLTPVYLAALLLLVEAVREPSLFPAFFGTPSAAEDMSSRSGTGGSGTGDGRGAEGDRRPAVAYAAAATVAPIVPEKSVTTSETEKSASDLAKRGGGVIERADPASETSPATPDEATRAAALAPSRALVTGRPVPERNDPASGDLAISDPPAAPLAAEEAAIDPASAAAAEDALRLSRSDRREVQRRLQLAQFDPQLVDGIFGPATREAVTAWQEAAGLPATGYVDEPAMALLVAQTSDEYRSWRAAEQARSRRRKEAQSAVVVSSAPPVPSTVERGACRRLPSGELAFGKDVRCNFRAFSENVKRDFRGLTGDIHDLFD